MVGTGNLTDGYRNPAAERNPRKQSSVVWLPSLVEIRASLVNNYFYYCGGYIFRPLNPRGGANRQYTVYDAAFESGTALSTRRTGRRLYCTSAAFAVVSVSLFASRSSFSSTRT